MCVVCLALYGLRPRERTASEGPPKRGRRSFRASTEVAGGVRDAGACGSERVPESAAEPTRPAEAARPLLREGRWEKAPVIVRRRSGRESEAALQGFFRHTRKATKVKTPIGKASA
jgi:hypothetical protein